MLPAAAAAAVVVVVVPVLAFVAMVFPEEFFSCDGCGGVVQK